MNAPSLKALLDHVRNQEDLKPVIDVHGNILKTFCNIALDRVLGLYGAPRLIDTKGQPLLANDMIDKMRAGNGWERVDSGTACPRASQGWLVVACQQEEGHGHVSPVYPIPEQYSPSWKKDVPMLSNVGEKNGILRASECFRTEPEYYSIKLSGIC